ncbi:sirohydrochlorin chelatase [Streptomyces gamaensis]|uniref:Sirohydrochlorin chelatase n=1 Tax=Streptomyces gamaensis TaxID=1763542 RepID=A0ABW0Z1D7_9ACTN
MSSPNGPAPGLPVRMPRPRQPGRHRRPEPAAAPAGAPPLVLAVPGEADPATRALAEEVLSIARSELPGLDAYVGRLDGDGDSEEGGDQQSLELVLSRAAAQHDARVSEAREAGEAASPEEAALWERWPSAVVVPLLAGPDNSVLRRIRHSVMNSGSAAELSDTLGPHPLLAEALHVRLSEAGLARADRARLFTVATYADGIILATVGGDDAVAAAGITGMLLSARLAVPVLAAALDEEGAIARAADQLRAAGSQSLALAPYLIGPEIAEGLADAAAKEAECAAARPLGAYPAVGKLVVAKYTEVLGMAAQPSPQGAPTR